MPESFKPIHSPISLEEVQKEKPPEESVDLLKEIEAMRDVMNSLEMRLQECLKTKEELASLSSRLEEEKKSLLTANKELENALADLKLSKEALDKLCRELSGYLPQIERGLKEDLKDLAINIAKQLYLTDKLSKEEVVVRALEKVFNSNISIGGEVRIFLNPKDYQLVEQSISKFLDETKNLSIELIKRGDINRGDFLMETSGFWIERRLDDILKEIEEEL